MSASSSTNSCTCAVCFSLISRAKTLRASRISGTSSTTTPAGRCSRASSGTRAAPSPAAAISRLAWKSSLYATTRGCRLQLAKSRSITVASDVPGWCMIHGMSERWSAATLESVPMPQAAGSTTRKSSSPIHCRFTVCGHARPDCPTW